MGPGPLSSLLRPTRCLGPSRAAAPSPAGSLSPICRLSASQLGSWSVGGGGAPLTHIPCAGKAGAAGSVGGASRATGLSQPLPSPALPARPPSPCCSHASGGRLRLQSHAASRRPGPRLLAALSFTEAASWESTNAAAGEPVRAWTAARGARQERPRGDQRAMPGRTAPQAGGRQGGRAERSCCRARGGLSAPTRCRARAEPALSRRDSAATVSNVGPRISGHFPERSTKPRSQMRGHAPQFLAPTAPRHPNVSSGGTG